jgi:anti-sigma-K factor RskA
VNCAQRKELILLYAFDQLEPAEGTPLTAHLREGCPRCAGELAAARTLSGLVGLTVPQVDPSPEVKERLFRRISDAKVVPFRGGRMGWPSIAAAALLAASVTAFAILIPARRGLEAVRAELAAARDAVRSLETRTATAEAAFRSMGSPSTRMTALTTTSPHAEASGRLFWDESKSTWHVFFNHMKPTGPGRTYELWLVTPNQRKVPAGTFAVGADGNASLDVTRPNDLAVALAAVTEEPEGGVPQPTGQILLVGKLGV